MTGREAITAALRLIGVLASGETATAAEASDGLSALNRMISSWSTEGLMTYSVVREEFTLTVNDGIYTMGASGDFNTTRPTRIESASIEDQSASPTTESPLRLINSSEWAGIATKDLSSTPQYLYTDFTNPLVTLNLWPRPDTADKLVVYSVKVLTAVSTLDTSITMPPGYDDAIVYNLAVRLAPEYGRQTPAEIAMLATESKASIKRVNHKPRYLKADSGALMTSGGGFDIVNGGAV